MQRDQGIVFIFGLIFNQGIQSQLAWRAPHVLKQRLALPDYNLTVLEALEQPTKISRKASRGKPAGTVPRPNESEGIGNSARE